MTMLATGRGERTAKRARLVVDISDIQVSDDLCCEIVTFALGSCIAVIVYDPRRRVGGMLHYMLPSAQKAPAQAKQRPAMFADTGIPLLFKQIGCFGCRQTDLIVKVAGGAISTTPMVSSISGGVII
ncbi:MAG: chemotaxis protein CheD [bacterium]